MPAHVLCCCGSVGQVQLEAVGRDFLASLDFIPATSACCCGNPVMLDDPTFRLTLAALALGLVIATFGYLMARTRDSRQEFIWGSLLAALMVACFGAAMLQGSSS